MDEVSTLTDATNVKTTSAQRRSESHRCEAGPTQKMARKATEELEKNKVQTGDSIYSNNRRYSKHFNSSRPEKKPGRLQQRTLVESKSREAAVETNREEGC